MPTPSRPVGSKNRRRRITSPGPMAKCGTTRLIGCTEKSAIPMVRDQMALIQDVQTDEWWQDVTVPMLEVVRRRLRDLVRLIDRRQRRTVYTDFEDVMGAEAGVALPGFGNGTDFAKFR